MLIRRLVLALAVLAIGAAACSSTTSSGTEYSEQPSSIVIDVASGDVTVRSRPDQGAEVTIEASTGDIDTAIEPTLEDGQLRIASDCTADQGCEVTVVVFVGQATDVFITSGDGAVTVNGIEGAVSVTSGSGTVSLNTITGPIDVAAQEGDILGAILESQSAAFTTDEGTIDVTFETPIDDLTITSGDGNVTTQVPGGPYNVSSEATGDTDIQIDTDASSSRTLRISTGNGDVTIYRN